MHKVKIRTWEDMASEFGHGDDATSIECPSSFVVGMECCMPESRVIMVEKKNCGERYKWISERGTEWEITEEMIECHLEYTPLAIDRAMEFVEYCKKYPEQRFWQSLRNFTESNFIYISDEPVEMDNLIDTFYMK